MKSLSRYFRLTDQHTGIACNELDIQVGEHGDLEGVWVDGEDFSESADAMKLVAALIGPHLLQKLWADHVQNYSVDELVSSKKQNELKLETA